MAFWDSSGVQGGLYGWTIKHLKTLLAARCSIVPCHGRADATLATLRGTVRGPPCVNDVYPRAAIGWTWPNSCQDAEPLSALQGLENSGAPKRSGTPPPTVKAATAVNFFRLLQTTRRIPSLGWRCSHIAAGESLALPFAALATPCPPFLPQTSPHNIKVHRPSSTSPPARPTTAAAASAVTLT